MPNDPLFIRRQIIWPSPLLAQSGEELVRRLAADGRYVTFETRAEKGRVSHYVLAQTSAIRSVTGTVEALTGAETVKVADVEDVITSVRLVSRGVRFPLLDRASEVSRQLLGALSAAKFKGESAVLRVSILGGVGPQLLGTRSMDPTQSLPSKVLHGTRPASGEINAKLRRKLEEPAVRVLVTAGATAKSSGRQREILSGILAAFRTLQGPGTFVDFTKSDDHPARPRLLGRLTFSPREALASMAWPLDSDSLPGMPPAHPKQMPLRGSKFDASRVFALTTAPGPEKPIGISIESGLGHIHVLGPTNSGKSTAAAHLIAHSIRAGHSIFVIDAKSDLAEDTLRLVPHSRWDDVVVLDPAAEGPVVGINPFDSPGTPPEIIADTILQILHDLFPDAFGPRTSQATLAGLLTLAGHPEATLTMLPRLYEDHALRERLLKDNPSRDLCDFWIMFDAMSEGAKSQMIGPVRSRLSQYLLRPQLRRFLEQPKPRFNLNDLFTKKGVIVAMPLNSGLMGGPASELAGSLVVSLLLQLTLARLRLPKEQRHPVMIVVDEAQAFVHGSGGQLEDALSRSRAAGVGWLISHQARSQMPKSLMAAIDSNTLSKLTWKLQSDDARAMAAMAPDLTAEDWMSLPQYHVYAYLQGPKGPLGWVSGATLPPPKFVSDASAVRAHAAARWGLDAPTEQPAQQTTEPPIGRRPRGSA